MWNYLAEWQKHSLWDLVHAEGIGYMGIMGEIDKSSEDKKRISKLYNHYSFIYLKGINQDLSYK